MDRSPDERFSDVLSARSMLFVPGDRDDRFEKAAASGADLTICDLEDAVPPERKEAALHNVVRWLATHGTAAVRINSSDHPAHSNECESLRGLSGLQAVVVPKAEDPSRLEAIGGALGGDVPLIALVETALGVHLAYDVARARGVARLAFGSIDFALDTNMAESEQSLLLARSTLVIASRAAGIAAPVDGVTTNLRDLDLTRVASRTARELGFGGNLCIHPNQVPEVNTGFSPTDNEMAWAQSVIDSAVGEGASTLDGQMVDKPVVERARAILKLGEAARSTRREPPEDPKP